MQIKLGRVVGVDYGTKKIGISIADPLQLFATPVGSFSPSDAVSYLVELHSDQGIECVVIGWPEAEVEGSIHRSIKSWMNRVSNKIPGVEIISVDESFSSREAEAALYASGVKKKERRSRGRVDQAAAAIILQRYLDGKNA